VRLWAAALLLALCGCATGVLYTHTVFPLTRDLSATPVVAGPGVSGSVKQIRYRGLDVRWDGNAIGEIAAEHGLSRVDYADVEVIRVLSVWTRTYVRVYGEPAAP
jgi:hypothetical protein